MTQIAVGRSFQALRELAALTSTQYQVLSALAEQLRPQSVQQLSEHLKMHPNTLREHLEVLCEKGQVKRSRQKNGGRGRPVWYYEPAVPASFEIVDNLATYRSSAVKKVLERRGIEIDILAAEFGREWAGELFAHEVLPTHAQIDPKAPESALELHLSKVRIFLSSLGFSARTTQSPQEMILLTCPVWGEEREVDTYQLNLYWAFLDEIMRVVTHGQIRASLVAVPKEGYSRLRLHGPELEPTASIQV
ncbi:hypothetical protein BSR29_01390 [Boudabousia liubingyangii]|uniref:HTH arsR-type domain-containing protein n=1 Tax=Boudabousia liubingyangii TaxID=1921764 RepID=A0A1Q5PPV7_9ACTO|nr:ArsR family transcriptional regulator [Boudabousia liubingyangii]OKL49638.1 hypothetical protein BSR29_01390 [Boudabousia liubingyangii]